MRPHALLLLLAACPGPGPPDEIIRGVQIHWASRTYAEAPDYLARCATVLEVEEFQATAWFFPTVPEVTAACGYGPTYPVAGCTRGPGGLLVSDAATLWSTALCHELAHAVLWRAGDPDADHTLPIWSNVHLRP